MCFKTISIALVEYLRCLEDSWTLIATMINILAVLTLNTQFERQIGIHIAIFTLTLFKLCLVLWNSGNMLTLRLFTYK